MSTRRKSKKLSESYYVVSENVVATKLSDCIVKVKETLILGTLVHVACSVDELHVGVKVVNYEECCNLNEESVWICPLTKLLPVDKILWPLISAIPSRTERVNILKDRDLCQQLASIEKENLVKFYPSGGNGVGETAVVKYKGPIMKMGRGIYFGIELLDVIPENRLLNDDGSSDDGCFAGQRFFSCPPGTGRFVTVNQLRLTSTYKSKNMPTNTVQTYKTTAVLQLKEKFENMSCNNSSVHNESKNSSSLLADKNNSEVPLKTGDHVVWVNDDSGPVFGIVRRVDWQDLEQPKVEVEFMEGLGDGMNCATSVKTRYILPVLELVKAEDFYGNSDSRKPKEQIKSEISSGYQSAGSGSSNCRDVPALPSSCKLRHSSSFQWNKVNNTSNNCEAVNNLCTNIIINNTNNTSIIPNNNDDKNIVTTSGVSVNINSSSNDLCDFVRGEWWEPTKQSSSSGKTLKLNNITSSILPSHGDLISLGSPSSKGEPDSSLTGSEVTNYYDSPERGVVIEQSQNQHNNTDCSLGVGSVVEVPIKGEPHYGVIRWIGVVVGDKQLREVAGIEMEEEHVGLTDGTFHGRRYFQCNPQRALFVSLNQCKKDSRFQEPQPNLVEVKTKEFGLLECPVIPGIRQPITLDRDIESICGKNKGIQGHHNSCYLDATLFSMFTFTSVFDSLLFRPSTDRDIDHYEEVQRVLREEIVNPLRENLFVRADRVMKLRTLLEQLSSVSGLTSEEKDPEEFLTSLVAQILRAEPFLQFSTGQEAYHYQLFVEKDEQLTLPTVQQLFEQSFLTSDIKLKQVPSCLIIQMPRFGKSFKMYPRILPSQLLDVTDVIENSPRQCTVCGRLAEFECKECFDQCDEGLQSISFCGRCLETVHSHQRRSKHRWRCLSVPAEFSVLQEHCVIPRLFMELFAVVCIETSHYVAFVKCGTGSEAPWCFFDSMADRKGEQNGYNIPEMVPCPNLPYWLSEKGAQTLCQVKDDRQLPEHAKRLLCDAYMCMYQSSEVMMYR
ncbi:ubiquitin carboxyl-terminal hydrolase CYLD [Lycorma delicatula]|uniref:ubiquitin carboxyl-terminal hydrolase CYLD n=1 Tax=Lycorma delicatula TaxID=130591 RepID=UPI003F50D8AE